jgi:hypothetical protein
MAIGARTREILFYALINAFYGKILINIKSLSYLLGKDSGFAQQWNSPDIL